LIGTIRRGTAKALLVAGLVFPQVLSAEKFTGQTLLTWDTQAQDNFLEVSLVMASTIAARIRPEHSDCISENFYEIDGAHASGKSKIPEAIAEYPTL